MHSNGSTRYLRTGRGLRVLMAFVVMAVSVPLVGCGYHLRGTTDLAPTYERVHVSGLSSRSDVYRTLASEFDNASATLVDDPREATARLVVVTDRVDRRVSVVDPGADVRQYELVHELAYHVELPDGSRTPTREIRQARNYNYDPTGVLASSSNENQIRRELGELVGQLLFYRLLAPIDPDTLVSPDEGR